jgi:hypothetical protein
MSGKTAGRNSRQDFSAVGTEKTHDPPALAIKEMLFNAFETVDLVRFII